MNEQVRRAIASYTTYQEAERAVDHLSDHGFPVERVAIIGQDVRLVEQVTGRMGHGRAALHGAASGALPGALIGWIFGLLNWLDPVVRDCSSPGTGWFSVHSSALCSAAWCTRPSVAAGTSPR